MSKPVDIDPSAERVFSLLAGRPEAAEIVLGGYFALQHYTNYRRTHDVDAWWRTRAEPAAEPAAERAIREAMRQVAAEEGSETRERRFGDTLSFELVRAGKKELSFQIAARTIGLEEPTLSPWPPVLIETIADNLASKMNALVNRGAPRDFTDIKHAVDEGFVTVPGAWDLWARKNPGEDLDSAKQKALLHLAGLEGRRPLEAIPDVAERERAQATRVVQTGVPLAMSPDFIDHSVYPDLDELPETFETAEAQADYVHRVCSTWDYGVHPEPETFALFEGWKEVFDRFPVPTSPGYHAFRAWFGWPPVATPANIIGPTPRYLILDRLEERGEDPCERMI